MRTTDVLPVFILGLFGWVVVIRYAIASGVTNVPYSNGIFSWILTLGGSIVLNVVPLLTILLIGYWYERVRYAYRAWRDPYHMVREWRVP